MSVPTYRPIRAVSPYGNAPASQSGAFGLGPWVVRMRAKVPPYLPQGSTMAYGTPFGRLGVARSAALARRPAFGEAALDPITGIANAVSSVLGFGSQIASSVTAKKDRKLQEELARQQQQYNLLSLQQQALAGASSERTTMLLVGGGLAAIAALGAVALSVRGRRKNGRRRSRR